MVGIHVLNPFLFVFTKVMPRIIGPYYRAFGVTGVLALPFITLTLEKVGYDTFLAARGRDPPPPFSFTAGVCDTCIQLRTIHGIHAAR